MPFLNNERGFSLLFISLLFFATGLLTASTIPIALKVSEKNKTNVSLDRLQTIQKAAKIYYRGHQNLPSVTGNRVPVTEFGLNSEYIFDGYGQEIYYNIVNFETGVMSGQANIAGMTVDSTTVSGALLSSGANKKRDSQVGSAITPLVDDIVVGIDVTGEANEIARKRLEVLTQNKWVTKYCLNDSAYGLDELLSNYDLPSNTKYDPWGNFFREDGDGNYYSIGGAHASGRITMPQKKSSCPDSGGEKTYTGGVGTPPGGSQLADAYWDFNGSDYVGINLGNGVTITSKGENKGLEFNDGYSRLNNRYTHAFQASDSFSLVTWVRAPASTRKMSIISKMNDSKDSGFDYDGNDSGRGYDFGFKADTNYLYFIMTDDNGNSIAAHGVADIDDNSCHHLVITFDGSNQSAGITIYVDGVPLPLVVDSDDGPLEEITYGDVSFQVSGRYVDASSSQYNFAGIVDDVAIYYDQLAVEEIYRLYDRNGASWSFCSDEVTCSDLAIDDPNVCNGKGVCVGQDTCVCEEGYQGDDCGMLTTCNGIDWNLESSCGLNGTCIAQDTCECDPGYYTDNATDPCGAVLYCGGVPGNYAWVCMGRGQCVDDGDGDANGVCQCPYPYSGELCQDTISCGGKTPGEDDDICSGQGTCVANDVCECDDGYYDTAEGFCLGIRTCDGVAFNDLGVCSGQGVCVDEDTCECEDGYYGDSCDRSYLCDYKMNGMDGVCSDHGTCVGDNLCECDNGWSGTFCDEPITCGGIPALDENVCSGRGICVEQDVCICEEGASGIWCND